jgi:hypothetical protein
MMMCHNTEGNNLNTYCSENVKTFSMLEARYFIYKHYTPQGEYVDGAVPLNLSLSETFQNSTLNIYSFSAT